ncbi:PqqD family protein [Paenibacillus rigui]|uniref:PqqD family protein n=1 Tax=Paenibacillus rigui TaxID=554312 RepID=A0A229UP24_9BACL|nr:PqqD family protein [Paenibacillus rigui]OXM85206.1 PqqD family protein [Paenibacillus rigui]
MTQYVWRNQYETVELDGEWIILNTDSFTVTKLNDLGGFCWTLLQSAQTLPALLQAVHEQYEAVSPTAEQELESFVTDLMQRGLLKYAV